MTAVSRSIPLQQHLYNGLARPIDYSVFARKWTRRLWASPCWRQEWTCPHEQRNIL